MVCKVEKVKTYQMGSNKQVYNFSKNVGQVSQQKRNISRRRQTNNVFKHVFWSRKSKSRNVSYGVEQTSFQFFKNCRSSKSRNSKHIEVWSRKSRHNSAGSSKQDFGILKIFDRESQNVSVFGRESGNSSIGSSKYTFRKLRPRQ